MAAGIFNAAIFNNAIFNTGASAAAVTEISNISAAFAQDMGPIHLLPHEWRQLKRIEAMMKRDEQRAVLAMKLFRRRATKMRASLRVRPTFRAATTAAMPKAT